jgi:hypothetical protein
MSAPEEYETDAGLGYGGLREPYQDGRAQGQVGYGPARTGRPGPPRPASPRWGLLPARRGIVVVFSTTAVGAVGTLVLGGDPGALLGLLVIVGSVAAAFGVDFRRGYLLLPVPTLAYAVGATATGMFHDRGVDISHTALLISAARWFAGGFLWMTAATIGLIAITALRWLAWRHGPDSRSSSAGRSSRPGRSATGTSPGGSRYRR